MDVRVRREDIPRDVIELCRRLADHGYRAWVVGGCLRDLLLAGHPADWDLATDARPEQVQGVFPKVIPTGIQHGTVTVRHRGQGYEITTLRGEGAYSDGRRPDSVSFVTDIEQDLSRRDFTVNAMAYDPLGERLVDPFGGSADLSLRLIRAVGDAQQRFSEDGLRVLRAARFCASLEFELDSATEAAIGPTLPTFAKVSAERVREEWLKALKAARPSRAFAVMHRTGILEVTCPRLAALPEPTWLASLAALDSLPRGDAILRLCGLLWPLSEQPDALADWLTRYRFANQERERILKLTSLGYARLPADGDAALRRFARKAGRAHLADLGRLAAALRRAHDGEQAASTRENCQAYQRLMNVVGPDTPLTHKELKVTGNELMRALSMAPGPKVGQLLDRLLDRVLDEPELNQPETLLELARQMQ